MIIFQRGGSQIHDKYFLGLWNWKEAFNRYACQKGKERVYNYKFAKVNALMKGKSITFLYTRNEQMEVKIKNNTIYYISTPKNKILRYESKKKNNMYKI